ncbi:MAG: hypothetical protein H3C62_07930 [Gemmatimonadaceae bacterium]|nr:hypothetical protein [Gemmatimonadaceae bacterium]
MMTRTSVILALVTLGVAAPVTSAQAQADMLGSYSGTVRATSFAGGKDASKMSGSVTITPSKTSAGTYKVEIRLSTRGDSPTASSTGYLQWSISPGRCGARVQFLVQPSEVSPLDIRSGGNAEVMWEGKLPLTGGEGSYQLMIYDRGVREQDIVGCANLKYNKPKS